MNDLYDRSKTLAAKFEETIKWITNIATVEKLSVDDLQEVFDIGLELFKKNKKIRSMVAEKEKG